VVTSAPMRNTFWLGTVLVLTVVVACGGGASDKAKTCDGGTVSQGVCNVAPTPAASEPPGSGKDASAPVSMPKLDASDTPVGAAPDLDGSIPVEFDGGTTTQPDAAIDSGAPPPVVGTGVQNDPCQPDGCADGLACYGASFCSKECASDGDCAGIAGGTHTCSSGAGGGSARVCRVAGCVDDGDCPAGLSCTTVAAGQTRCVLVPPRGDSVQNDPCAASVECAVGLGCYAGLYCSKQCMSNTDCADLTGANFTCSSGANPTCRVMCSKDADCQADFVCADIGTTGNRCVPPP
jgi:hypothetical protein